MQRITLGILAHVDAGKTTLSEQLLVCGGVRREAGRVDHQNTLMDADAIEKRRGITVFADQCAFSRNGRDYTLIDTPGHIDFCAETERAIAALDCAVLLADASEPLRPHTRLLAALAQKHNVPFVLFLNKCDLTAANPDAAAYSAAERLGKELLPYPFADERLAELDESFLDVYLSGQYSAEARLEALRRVFAGGEVLPVFKGSALRGEGAQELLDGLEELLAPRVCDADAPLSARVYKVRRDSKGQRAVYLRILHGTLNARDVLVCGEETEKIHEIRIPRGIRHTLTDRAFAGDCAAVTGSALLRCGDLLAQNPDGLLCVSGHTQAELKPVLASAMTATDGTPLPVLLEKLRFLEDEDPLLQVSHEKQTGEILVRVMGPVQLEILTELMEARYGIRVCFSETKVLYTETVAAPVDGCGHYEPLRHYAEAHVLLEPLPRGSGMIFESRCPVDRLALPYQKAIENALKTKEHKGVLTGAPLTDVRIVLTDGRGHDKHTEGGDFREASCRAVRQALMHADNLLLEPFYRFEITVPQALSGRVISDVTALSGACEAPMFYGRDAVITGRGPVATLSSYPLTLRALTHGEGSALMFADGYDVCHNTDEAVKAGGYNPDADLENPAGSVFCAHGAGYPVSWQEARSHMHCLH